MLEIPDKNVFKIVTLPNNLILISRLLDHNLVFCSLYMIHEICVSEIWLVKTSTRIVNTNH